MKSSKSSINTYPNDSQTLRHFFDSIACRYDLINQFLSFHLDHAWRQRSCEIILEGHENSLLDLGIGTGKFTEIFLKAQSWKKVAGLDFSEKMLESARRLLPSHVQLVQGDFEKLPFDSESFDLVISSYTLRSVQHMEIFLKGVYRVLTPGGKAAFLCLTRPQSLFWRFLSYPYLKFYLPFMGGLLSGNFQAYQFLSNSILGFQEPEKTAAMMRQLGFRTADIYRFSFGLAALIVGKK